jgi:hippurate hydrolase
MPKLGNFAPRTKLENGGTLENAKVMAAHASVRTTQLGSSKRDGRMHACGHDGHTTMLLGAARYLAETRDFAGTANFIFQPAEEGIGGAKAMIDDGLFERFPCDSVFGMHNRPDLPIGKFAIRPGPMMAGGAFFDITVTGKGSHGARPEEGIDPC